MKILGTTLSQERFLGLLCLFLGVLVLIVGRSVYFRRESIPTWVFVAQVSMFGLASLCFFVDYRKSK